MGAGKPGGSRSERDRGVAGTSPSLNEHLNRFGSYEFDLRRPPAPLPFDLPGRLQPPLMGTATVPVRTRGASPLPSPIL